MQFDKTGKYHPLGKLSKTYDWSVANDSVLPQWLVTTGVSPIVTFSAPSSSRGAVRLQTKSATPAIGDKAGLETAFAIDYSKYEEVAFIVYSCVTDSSSATDHTFEVSANAAGNGMYFSNAPLGTPVGTSVLRVYPAAAIAQPWQIALEGNTLKQKDIGIVIRPRKREVLIYAGDPQEGAGCVAYSKGIWVNPVGSTVSTSIITQASAQRYAEFSRVKLRLSGN